MRGTASEHSFTVCGLVFLLISRTLTAVMQAPNKTSRQILPQVEAIGKTLKRLYGRKKLRQTISGPSLRSDSVNLTLTRKR